MNLASSWQTTCKLSCFYIIPQFPNQQTLVLMVLHVWKKFPSLISILIFAKDYQHIIKGVGFENVNKNNDHHHQNIL